MPDFIKDLNFEKKIHCLFCLLKIALFYRENVSYNSKPSFSSQSSSKKIIQLNFI